MSGISEFFESIVRQLIRTLQSQPAPFFVNGSGNENQQKKISTGSTGDTGTEKKNFTQRSQRTQS
jgi:hypothetical protein